MERVVRGRSFTLSKTFYSDGTAVTPTGVPTVAISRSDGTTLATGSVSGSGTGPYTVTVTSANNTLLDTLTVTWTATIGGQPNTYIDTVEVAGDLLFSIAEARTAIGDPAYDASKIADARTYAETELESALGYALVPRYRVQTLSGTGCHAPLRLNPYVRSIRSVSVAGVALAAENLDLLTFDAGFLRGYWWPTGYSNVTVGYEHGLDTPPPGATRAALSLALDDLAIDTGVSGIDPRAESIITVDGTVRLRSNAGQFAAAGVNEWITANRLPMLA